jgi:AraC-like DNA-binding protein
VAVLLTSVGILTTDFIRHTGGFIPMRAAFEIVRLPEASSINCRRYGGERFSAIWHVHPEVELMYVEASRGIRFVGDHAARFGPGDLVLVGPNLPHVWLNTDAPKKPRHTHAIGTFLQFKEDFLGQGLWRTPEFAPVGELLRRSRHGIHFTGQEARVAAKRLREITRLSGAERAAAVLGLLGYLAAAPEQRVLCRADYVPKLGRADGERIEAACRYVRSNLTREISQPKAAALAKLSPKRFSTFFHQRMGCTFPAYVNRVRIARVIHLLLEENMSIAEACFASGFNNLSNFNHQFKFIKGLSPRFFLRQFRHSVREKDECVARSSWILPAQDVRSSTRRKMG